MAKYPYDLNLRAVCAAIDAFECQQDEDPQSGMIAAFEILLTASGIVQRAEAAEADHDNVIAQSDDLYKRLMAAEEKLAELEKQERKDA